MDAAIAALAALAAVVAFSSSSSSSSASSPPRPAAPVPPTLADDYRQRYARAQLRPERLEALTATARTMASHAQRYRQTTDPIGVPWYVLAIIHQLEHSGRFTTALDVQDPIDTPPGQTPQDGTITADQWDATALHELTRNGFDRWTDWTLPGVLYKLERFNGMGYRTLPEPIPSPYLWSYTDQYQRGKFVRANQYSPTTVSQQPGAAALLRRLTDLRLIDPPPSQ